MKEIPKNAEILSEIYCIENSVNEYHSRISAYFTTEKSARENLQYFSDWFRGDGTGTIYKIITYKYIDENNKVIIKIEKIEIYRNW